MSNPIIIRTIFLFFMIITHSFAETIDTAWVRTFDGTGNGNDYLYGNNSIAVDDSGNIFLAGYSDGGISLGDYVTIKFLPNGDTAWVRYYNSPGNGDDEARAIAVDGNGSAYVTGKSAWQIATIKYDKNGNEKWVARYSPGGLDAGLGVVTDKNGNVYVIGHHLGNAEDYVTIKYDSLGNEQWSRIYDGEFNEQNRYWADLSLMNLSEAAELPESVM